MAFVSISCTVVLHPPPLVAHVFWNLSVREDDLIERAGSLSIVSSTLLAALQVEMQLAKIEGHLDTISPTITALLEPSVTNRIGLATMRVPDFSSSLESVANGYRRLASVNIPESRDKPPAIFDPALEVLAIEVNHSRSLEYMNTWAPFGLIPERHFILILIAPNEFILLPPTLHRSRSESTAPPAVSDRVVEWVRNNVKFTSSTANVVPT